MKKHLILAILAGACCLEGIGQTKKVFVSKTLVVECDTSGTFNEPYLLEGNDTTQYPLNIYFVNSFNNITQVSFNGKKVFQGLLKTDVQTGIVLSPGKLYITPSKSKKEKLSFFFPNLKFKVETNLLKGYNHLYVYKENRKLSLLYTNTRLFFD